MRILDTVAFFIGYFIIFRYLWFAISNFAYSVVGRSFDGMIITAVWAHLLAWVLAIIVVFKRRGLIR